MDEGSSEREIERIFYETGLLKNDLIPILTTYANNERSGVREQKAALASGRSRHATPS